MTDGQHEYFGKRELVSPNLVGIFRGKVFVRIATNFCSPDEKLCHKDLSHRQYFKVVKFVSLKNISLFLDLVMNNLKIYKITLEKY